MEDRIFVTAKQAETLFDKRTKQVHTYKGGGSLLIGCDWEIKEVLKTIRKNKAEIGGDNCKNMGHGLVVWDRQEPMFVEVDRLKLEKLEKELQKSA